MGELLTDIQEGVVILYPLNRCPYMIVADFRFGSESDPHLELFMKAQCLLPTLVHDIDKNFCSASADLREMMDGAVRKVVMEQLSQRRPEININFEAYIMFFQLEPSHLTRQLMEYLILKMNRGRINEDQIKEVLLNAIRVDRKIKKMDVFNDEYYADLVVG